MLPITESLFQQNAVKGDFVSLKTTDAKHFNGRAIQPIGEDTAKNFTDALTLALDKVNDQQVNAEMLGQKVVSNPTGVEAHTLMIQAEKARMSLTLVKNIADLAVRTYRELSNLR